MPYLLLSSLLCALALFPSQAAKLHPPSEPWRYARWLFGRSCSFMEDPATAVEKALRESLVAQEEAIGGIVDRFRQWQHDATRGMRYPLIFSFTGTTGIGKTSAAFRIAEALSPKKNKQGAPEARVFIDISAKSAGGVSTGTKLQQDVAEIRHVIAEGLYQCGGNVVLIVDEIQKAQPGLLAAFAPITRSEHAVLSYEEGDSKGTRHELDARNMVVIFTSDIGSKEMLQLMARTVAKVKFEAKAAQKSTSSSGYAGQLRRLTQRRIRQALSERGVELGIDLGQHAQAVVPFLPLLQDGVRQVLARELDNIRNLPSAYWDFLTFQSAEFADLLSDMSYTEYQVEKEAFNQAWEELQKGASGASTETVELHADGTTSSTGAEVETHSCSRAVPLHVYAKYGARHLLSSHAASPVSRLLDFVREALVNANAPRRTANGKSKGKNADGHEEITVQLSADCPQQTDLKNWASPNIRILRCVAGECEHISTAPLS